MFVPKFDLEEKLFISRVVKEALAEINQRRQEIRFSDITGEGFAGNFVASGHKLTEVNVELATAESAWDKLKRVLG